MTTTCERCGLTVEVDSREDAHYWGLNHWAAFHEDRK